jgi:hypothetical protein
MLDDGLGDEELMTVQGLEDYGDYGALYQAPDGSLYQMSGFDDEFDGSLYAAKGFDDDLGGPGDFPGEVRQGADGRLYQWVEGYDGLGDPVGFWSLIPSIAKTVLPVVASKVVPRLRRILPQALRSLRQFAPVVPPVQPMPVVAPRPVVQPTPVVQPASEQPETEDTSDDLTGFGALYQAPDGSLYQLQDYADEEQLAEDEFVRGLDEDERYGEDEDLRDTDGYVRGAGEGGCCCPGIRGVDAYVPPEPPQTRPFVRPEVAPDMWRPLW